MLTNLKGEIGSNTIIVKNFSTPHTQVDRSSRQKSNKEAQALNDTLNQMDIIAIYRAFNLKSAECTFFSRVWNTLQDRSQGGSQGKPW